VIPATEAVSSSSAVSITEVASAQRQEVAQNPPPKKPSAPNVVPAVVPLRVLPIDPPVRDGLIPASRWVRSRSLLTLYCGLISIPDRHRTVG
jgi:hypothetical protein